MPLLLTVSCFSKIQIGFTFLVLAHLGSPRKGPINGCVCVCVICALAKIFSMLYNKGHQQHFSIIALSSDQVTSTFSSTIKLLHGSLTKLLTSNHAHTKFSLDPTKRMVWANTQFITVRFISLSFFVFRLIITHTNQRIFMICNVVQRYDMIWDAS